MTVSYLQRLTNSVIRFFVGVTYPASPQSNDRNLNPVI